MITCVTLVNDPEQFERCRRSLLREGAESPPWIEVRPNERGWNASRGLNHGIDAARTPWVLCTHQDVLFPRDWLERVRRVLAGLPPEIALVGVVGSLANGALRGHIEDPNGHCYWGPLPARVLVLDEAVMLLRRSSALRFDEEVPGFHLYGADLCLRAHERGLGVLAIDAPVRHLSTGTIDASYERAKGWLLERWGPGFGYIVPTPAALLEDVQRCSPLRWAHLRWRRRRDVRRRNRHGLGSALEIQGV